MYSDGTRTDDSYNSDDSDEHMNNNQNVMPQDSIQEPFSDNDFVLANYYVPMYTTLETVNDREVHARQFLYCEEMLHRIALCKSVMGSTDEELAALHDSLSSVQCNAAVASASMFMFREHEHNHVTAEEFINILESGGGVDVASELDDYKMSDIVMAVESLLEPLRLSTEQYNDFGFDVVWWSYLEIYVRSCVVQSESCDRTWIELLRKHTIIDGKQQKNPLQQQQVTLVTAQPSLVPVAVPQTPDSPLPNSPTEYDPPVHILNETFPPLAPSLPQSPSPAIPASHQPLSILTTENHQQTPPHLNELVTPSASFSPPQIHIKPSTITTNTQKVLPPSLLNKTLPRKDTIPWLRSKLSMGETESAHREKLYNIFILMLKDKSNQVPSRNIKREFKNEIDRIRLLSDKIRDGIEPVLPLEGTVVASMETPTRHSFQIKKERSPAPTPSPQRRHVTSSVGTSRQPKPLRWNTSTKSKSPGVSPPPSPRVMVMEKRQKSRSPRKPPVPVQAQAQPVVKFTPLTRQERVEPTVPIPKGLDPRWVNDSLPPQEPVLTLPPVPSYSLDLLKKLSVEAPNFLRRFEAGEIPPQHGSYAQKLQQQLDDILTEGDIQVPPFEVFSRPLFNLRRSPSRGTSSSPPR